MNDDFEQRHHPFDGCFNFRDIGGYASARGRTVKWGKYFRAGRQDRVTEKDRSSLGELGIKTQVDLRRPDEIDVQGRGPLESLGASYVHLPVIPEGGSSTLDQLVGQTGISGARYLGYLEFGPDVWCQLFDIFAAPERHPIVLHCTAGKDRTGVSTAFLLSVLCVERPVIELDYQLTNRDAGRQADYVAATGALPPGLDRDAMEVAAGVPDAAIGEFLDGLESRYGGAVAYLTSIGISDETMQAVRESFLEPSGRDKDSNRK